MAWLIALLAGANLFYGLENDLGALTVAGILLALVALCGSLFVLSSDFERGFAPGPRAGWPLKGRVSVKLRAVDPVADARPIVHQAGPPSTGVQSCVRCGRLLGGPGSAVKAFPAGALVVERSGALLRSDPAWGDPPPEVMCRPSALAAPDLRAGP
jgi:hypothetical protein